MSSFGLNLRIPPGFRSYKASSNKPGSDFETSKAASDNPASEIIEMVAGESQVRYQGDLGRYESSCELRTV